MKKLIGLFFQGLLYLAPISVTIYVLAVSFVWLDGLLRDLEIFKEGPFASFNFPGLGFIIIIGFTTLVGLVGQKLIASPITSLFDQLLKKAPLIKIIYTSVQDLLSAFVGKERKFGQPVLVQLDEAGIFKRLGFITSSDLSDLGISDQIAVYLPSSYGILGDLVIVPFEKVTPIESNSADVMKFIVSGGVTKVE